MKRRLGRLLFPAAATVGAGVAVSYAVRLSACKVPALDIAACVLALFATVTTAVHQAFEAATATTHRCKVSGCSFRVRIQSTDPGESRRWQEAAASHPAHTLTQRP
ncbi:hypothetical protein [Streptomyces netropsis]|uniref:Uncharacterized protein n=1 Tax=Streptomyces netropsis TaxID=55404 RepID=A0A7W7LGZ6_STRNE|nr:hypothetical protein [Streptomyces netropsis]MBB4889747.1 hypothetical protein [Streptomyces netropsis]GGR40836.1 hypothetical protein GCM10010219_52500 [Streptomyces netropsis]